MGSIITIVCLSGILIIVGIFAAAIENEKIALMTPDEKQKSLEKYKKITYGVINAELICPHCQTKGRVHTKYVTLKKGVSGAKATGAVLTAGLSLLATGLSRKEDTTQAHCENCNSTWFF